MKQRLKTILLGELVPELNRYKKPALAFAAVAAIAGPGGLGVWNAPAAHAQSASPKFEVASIKPSVDSSGFHNPDCTGDRFIVAGLRFGYLLVWAYDLRGAAAGAAFFERVPLSIRQKSYDIQAKADRPFASESQCRLMVQALLADRFKLAFHYEKRDAELFELVVARGGPKLRKALPTDKGTDVNFVLDGRPYTQPPIEDADTRAHTKGVTMQELAQWLPTPEPVADKTGLEGRYKIDLRISTSLAADNQDTPADPSLDAALAQLGLRLEKHKGPVKVPVLDHIEPPDAN
jgi:uncharacterized protein (TIGR03435 family)